jgi:hypothetical protein
MARRHGPDIDGRNRNTTWVKVASDCHDPLEVLLAHGIEQPGPVRLKVSDIEQPRIGRHEVLELCVAVDQRKRSQVAPVQPEQIEGVEEGVSTVP